MVGDYQARYTGGWADGVWAGQGNYSYIDGRMYRGSWEAGQQQGKGSLTWPDGDR